MSTARTVITCVLNVLLLTTSPCFAKDSSTISVKPMPFEIRDTPGVSTWSDYRGPEFDGYASIGKKESVKFWTDRLKSRGRIRLDSNSYKDLNHLWRMLNWPKARNDAANIDLDSKPARLPDIEKLLAEDSIEQKKFAYALAQDLADAYVDFKLTSQQSPQERTTDYLDACRARLVDLVGEGAVRDLEESWSMNPQAPEKRNVDKPRRGSQRN